ncbi:MAG: hypothetical protein JW757_02740 [Anaerolineales bacterium]|nr:hypothetical protein [Anaerolineales bacterium]
MNELRQAREDNDHELTMQKLEEYFDFEAFNAQLEVLKAPSPEILQIKEDLFAASKRSWFFLG